MIEMIRVGITISRIFAELWLRAMAATSLGTSASAKSSVKAAASSCSRRSKERLCSTRMPVAIRKVSGRMAVSGIHMGSRVRKP